MEDINHVFVDQEVPDVDYAELDFDQQIKHTQKIKNRILHSLVHSNPDGTIPTDKDSVELMLKVADSMDKSALGKKRLQVEEKSSNNAASVLAAIQQMVIKNGNRNTFAGDGSGGSNRNDDIGELPDFSDDHTPGEGEIGVITEASSTFTERMDEVNRADQARRETELGLRIEPT